jgi:hypothetical protein
LGFFYRLYGVVFGGSPQKLALASRPVTDYRLLFDWQTQKLEAKAPFTLVSHYRCRPHRRAHVRNKKLDADRLADLEL